MDDDLDDAGFNTLPSDIQQTIDNAFHMSALEVEPEESAGGFVLPPTLKLPLSQIETALAQVGLGSDDNAAAIQVLTAAATGWKDNTDGGTGEEQQGVALADWRAVCAVLLAPEGTNEQVRAECDDDAYEDDEDQDMESDEYNPEPERSSGARRSRRRPRSLTPDSDASEPAPIRRLTAAQKRTALECYALFFPPETKNIGTARLGVHELREASKVLGEGLTFADVRCF